MSTNTTPAIVEDTPETKPKMRRTSPRKRVTAVILSAVSVVLFAVMVFPVYWMISSSFLPTSKIRATTPTFFPGGSFTWNNYRVAIFESHGGFFMDALRNSLIVTFFTLIVTLIIGFLAALAVARYKFFGRNGFIVAILMIQMLPGAAMMWTYFRMMSAWGLTNNLLGLGLLYVCGALPFTIWTLRGFVLSVPPDLEEAAMVDGCSRNGAFWRITFPLLAPGLVSTGIFAFITAWNEFTTALIMLNKPDYYTLPIWLRYFQQATRATDWGALMAGSTLIAIPVMIFFLIVQGRMTGGLVAGAVKG